MPSESARSARWMSVTTWYYVPWVYDSYMSVTTCIVLCTWVYDPYRDVGGPIGCVWMWPCGQSDIVFVDLEEPCLPSSLQDHPHQQQWVLYLTIMVLFFSKGFCCFEVVARIKWSHTHLRYAVCDYIPDGVLNSIIYVARQNVCMFCRTSGGRGFPPILLAATNLHAGVTDCVCSCRKYSQWIDDSPGQ